MVGLPVALRPGHMLAGPPEFFYGAWKLIGGGAWQPGYWLTPSRLVVWFSPQPGGLGSRVALGQMLRRSFWR
jgi:hypothetical protein